MSVPDSCRARPSGYALLLGTTPGEAARYGNPFAAAGADGNGRASIEWGVYGVPETFIIGRDGRIAFKLIGPITADNLEGTLKPEIEKALTPSS